MGQIFTSARSSDQKDNKKEVNITQINKNIEAYNDLKPQSNSNQIIKTNEIINKSN